MLFQFQTGAIKRRAAIFDRCVGEERFNSKLVRLKVDDVGLQVWESLYVSIPNWCD